VTGAFVDVFVSSGRGGLDEPNGVVFGPDGNLYVSSNQTNQVQRYDGTTGAFIDVFVPGPVGVAIIGDLLFAPDGTLWIVSRNAAGEAVNRYNPTTGAFIDAFAAGGPMMTMDRKRAIPAPDGNVYVTSRGSDEVFRYNGQTGAFIDVFVSAGSGGIDGPLGSSFGPDGNLYISGQFSSNVVRYNGITGELIDAFVPAGTGGLNGATFIVFHEPIPEPGTIGLVATGIIALGYVRHRGKQAART
jgi:DNA-binding beta-propeller fold protein YncE